MRQNNTLPPIRSVLKPRDTHFLPSRELPTPRLHIQNTTRALKTHIPRVSHIRPRPRPQRSTGRRPLATLKKNIVHVQGDT